MQHRVCNDGWRLTWVRITGLVVFSLICSLPATAETSRLLIYLEVPDSPVPCTLTLNSLSLVGASVEGRELPLKRTALRAVDIAGKQVLLSSSSLPPGRYDEVKIDLSGIVGRVGVAEVTPGVPPDGVAIPLDIELAEGRTEVLALRWIPASVDPEADVHLPQFEVRHPAVPPLGSLAFATSAGSGAVLVIDRQTARVVAALAVDDVPRGLAYAPKEQILFAALADQDAIAVIDVISLRVINSIPLQFGDDPTRLLLSKDGATLFVICPGSRTLTALATWSQQQQFRVSLGEGAHSLAQDPVSGWVFVACQDEGRIQVIDPATGSSVRSLPLVSAPVEIVIDENSRLLFAGGSVQRSIRTFDLAQEIEAGDQNICGEVAGFGINRRNRRLYASVPACRQLAVLRPDIGIEFGSIDLPGGPGLMDFDQAFRELWVVLPREGAVAVCNVNRSRVERVVEVADHPYEVLVP